MSFILAFACYFLRLYFCQYFLKKETSLFHITIPDFIQKQRSKQHRAWFTQQPGRVKEQPPLHMGHVPSCSPSWPSHWLIPSGVCRLCSGFQPGPTSGEPQQEVCRTGRAVLRWWFAWLTPWSLWTGCT